MLMCKCVENLLPDADKLILLLFGVLAALEWHLQWAAASGMETMLFSLGSILFFYQATKHKTNWLLVGIISGLIVWVRPDGLTFLGPVAFVFLERILTRKYHPKKLLQLIVPFVIILGGYFLFNFAITGQLMPNTFYAKQMEYQELLAQPLGLRIFNEFSPIWVGICLFLIPGFITTLVESIRNRKLGVLGFNLWVLGYVVLFAIRLPVVYQHGRYVMPVIPLFMVIGFIGTNKLLGYVQKAATRRVVNFAVYGILLTISAAFFVRGIDTYRSDLQVIDTFMVQPAKWVEQNTANGAVIAVHDIGAMGFYADRRLVDLAGLANPEVIPFIRDEVHLKSYIEKEKADYFVGFTDWYTFTAGWGEVVKTFTLPDDEIGKEVDIIKLSH
jgi:hypothetical protein